MRHRNEGRKLNRTGAHRKAMLRNLVCSLFTVKPNEGGVRRVTTTIPKAKEARRLAERLITLGKRGTLHARRRALALLVNKRAVKTLFEEVAPLYTARQGGYTRFIRLSQWRLGDGADLCYFELVAEPVETAGKAAEPVAPRLAEPQPPTPAAPSATDKPPEGQGGEEPAAGAAPQAANQEPSS